MLSVTESKNGQAMPDGVEHIGKEAFEKKDHTEIRWLGGGLWMVGDSRLLDVQLNMSRPDVILFDFSDNDWHITFEGAVKLANAYPEAELICIHWGTVDAPDFDPFNGDPRKLTGRVRNPERIQALRPGEAFLLKRS